MENDEKKKRPGQEKYIPIPGPGRDSELTPEVQKIVCDKIRRGNYLETAALAAGVNKRTLHRWLKLGKEQPGSVYEAFCHAVDQAEAEWEEGDLNVIHLAARGAPAQYDKDGKLLREEVKRDPKMAAWRLARRRPKTWGRTEKHEISGKDGAPLTFVEFVKQTRAKKDEDSE